MVGSIFVLLLCASRLSAQTPQLPKRPHFYLQVGGQLDSMVNPATVMPAEYMPRLWYGLPAAQVLRPAAPFAPSSYDYAFYFLLAVLFLTALARYLFPKYFADLNRVIFQTGFRQKSLREQLQQNKLASLVLNTLFVISGGTFLWLIARYKGFLPEERTWLYLGLSICFVAAVYLVKNIALDLAKWLFNLGEALDTYKFIVFVLNKVLGLVLIPVCLVMWLGQSTLQPVVFTLAMVLLGFAFLYRYMLAFPVLRMVGRLSGFHFLLYLCAFELVPILILAKILLSFLMR